MVQVHLASRFQIECSPVHRGSSSGTALGGNHRKDGLMTNARQLVIEAKCSKCKRETKTQHNHPTTCLANSQPVTRPPTRSYFAANAYVSRQFRVPQGQNTGETDTFQTMATTNTFYQLCLPIYCSKKSQI